MARLCGRGQRLRADALLRYQTSLPIALVQTRRHGETFQDAAQRLFATYQAIASDEHRVGLYHNYPRDFFDLVIVDECHRGSAQDDSNWRDILTYFTSAVQVGLTATPRRTDNVQTYAYFGDPVSTYALRVGINDGFLAPYRVRRVLLRKAEDSTVPDVTRPDAAGDELASVANAGQETSGTLVASRETIAQHLARYLRQTDTMAKTIVFCVDQDHAKQIVRYPDYVERIVSGEGVEGKRALGRFSTPSERTPVIATPPRSCWAQGSTCQRARTSSWRGPFIAWSSSSRSLVVARGSSNQTSSGSPFSTMPERHASS